MNWVDILQLCQSRETQRDTVHLRWNMIINENTILAGVNSEWGK